MHVLIGGAFRAAVRRVEIKRLRFADGMALVAHTGGRGAVYAGNLPINLIRGSEQDERTVAAAARGFENVESATGIDFEIVSRIVERCGDRYLGSEMVDFGRRRGRLLHCVRIADIGNGNTEAPGALRELLQPLQIMFDLSARKIVKNMNLRIGISQKMMGPVRAYEAGSSENQNGTSYGTS